MKTYKELYKKDNNENIRVWWADQEGSKYRMCSGVYEGGIVKSTWTTTDGKNIGKLNETSPEEQATKEIDARYKKQRDGGYWDNIKDVDKADKFFSPMLAEKYLEYKNEIDWGVGVFVSPKMDGLRCVIDKNSCRSRNGKLFISFPHILQELNPIFDENPHLLLDGEIYTHTFSNNFNKIISLAKKTKPTDEDLTESKKHLQYWVFDAPTTDLPFRERFDWLKESFNTFFNKNKYVKLCPHHLVHSEKELEEALEEFISQGYEGLMVNLPNSLYENKRTTALMKYKRFIDEECEILDIEEGDGNRSGMFGRAILRKNDGVIFEANSRGDEESYIRLLKEKKDVIGKMATVRYQNLTPDNKPRFGVIIEIRDYE